MNNMEERLWEYIDGNCSEEERIIIAALIEKDDKWRTAYNDMLMINTDISALTLDEPSMAFSYKVMEGIRADEATKPLKTSINKFIVNGIAAFFVLSIIAIGFSVFSGGTQHIIDSNNGANINLPDLSLLFDSAVMKVVFYVDVMLLLFFADGWLRNNRNTAKIKSVQN